MTNNSDSSKVEFAIELFRKVEEEAQRSFEISSLIEIIHDKLDFLNRSDECEHFGKLTDVCNALQNTARQLNEHAVRLNKIFEAWSNQEVVPDEECPY